MKFHEKKQKPVLKAVPSRMQQARHQLTNSMLVELGAGIDNVVRALHMTPNEELDFRLETNRLYIAIMAYGKNESGDVEQDVKFLLNPTLVLKKEK